LARTGFRQKAAILEQKETKETKSRSRIEILRFLRLLLLKSFCPKAAAIENPESV
jgi:hypothetical protein